MKSVGAWSLFVVALGLALAGLLLSVTLEWDPSLCLWPGVLIVDAVWPVFSFVGCRTCLAALSKSDVTPVWLTMWVLPAQILAWFLALLLARSMVVGFLRGLPSLTKGRVRFYFSSLLAIFMTSTLIVVGIKWWLGLLLGPLLAGVYLAMNWLAQAGGLTPRDNESPVTRAEVRTLLTGAVALILVGALILALVRA